MNDSFVKLYGSILTSSVWSEDSDTKVVWITMLAMADQDGIVRASIPGLARFAGVSLEATETALNKFEAPDKYSVTTDDDGRRIEPVEGGWIILNHSKYRDMRTRRQVQDAERQKRKRERDTSRDMRDMSQMSHDVAPDTYTDPDTDKKENTPLTPLLGGKSAKPPKPDISPILEAWRTHCVPAGLPEPLKIGPKRKKSLEARARDPGWMKLLPEAIQALLASPFHCGQNNTNWRADIDYFIRPDTAAKLVEKHRANGAAPRDLAIRGPDYVDPF